MNRGMVLVIDPGHGGKFNNATGNGLIEKDLVLKYAGYLEHIVRRDGNQVFLTRDGDYHLDENLDKDLLERARIANEIRTDVFISLHCNNWSTPEANGFEVWTSPGETRSDELATEIFSEVRDSFPMMKARADLGDGDPDKESKFVVLMKTKMPAALIELGFLTNYQDANILKRNMEEYCEAIKRGIYSWWENQAEPG